MPCLDILSYLAFEVFRLEGVSKSVSEGISGCEISSTVRKAHIITDFFFFTLVGPCSCGVGENDGGQDLN
eukprot:m.10892 g.10892  ORF g.10892 m.10892 type:complete len:70 (+) comp4366_c0_seq2:818-1027(+)